MSAASISDLSREAVVAALADFEIRHAADTGPRRAAVAIALGTDIDGATACLLTVRPAAMRAHPGQFALPGGAVDAGETVVEAAIRELGEELGVEAEPADVVGRLDDYVTRSGYAITPIVLWIGDRLLATEPNPAEVAFVLRPTMAEVDTEPRFISIPESDKPVIQWPFRSHLIHAPTGAIVYQFREVVLRGRHTRVDQLEQPVFAWR